MEEILFYRFKPNIAHPTVDQLIVVHQPQPPRPDATLSLLVTLVALVSLERLTDQGGHSSP